MPVRACHSPSTIERLTPEVLHAAAQWAAAQHIPLAEANHYEPGSDLWALFNQAYGGCTATATAAATAHLHARLAHHARRREQEAA